MEATLMKSYANRIFITFVVLLMIVSLYGCCKCEEKKEADSIPSDPNCSPPMLMVEGQLYFVTDERLDIEVEETDYLGRITVYVGLNTTPKNDGEASLPYCGSPYIKYKEGVAVRLADKWIFFKKLEKMTAPSNIISFILGV